ncbi:hypothetical protein WJX81_004601 [Elliptochloris bilobata]|uniref:Cyclin N-terminal domain-containing protein n=1 Tax=Elliptochloris bilobata TaxID=381761 RepID=A0AAW1QI69_9CHLO
MFEAETELDRYRSGRVFEYMWPVLFGEPPVQAPAEECALLHCTEEEQRAAAAPSVGSLPEGTGSMLTSLVGKRAVGQGKRKEEDAKAFQAGAGSKKGRSAFIDITNIESTKAAFPPEKENLPRHGRSAFSAPDAKATSFAQASQHLALLYQRASPASDGPDAECCTSQPGYVDIDAADSGDVLACPAYVHEIMDSLFLAELKRRPSTSYMSAVQTDINQSMRGILVDWLVEVAQEYKLVADTLFLAVSYLDRYLSLRNVPRARLQLVGITCMLLAAKYEEIYAPQIEEFCYITDNTYTRPEILAMEEEVLGALRFELTAPTPRVFLRRLVKAAVALGPADPRLEHLAAYVLELALSEYAALQWLPSQLAAGAVALARGWLGAPAWSSTLAHYARYDAPELRPVVGALHALAQRASCRASCQLPAVREKFAAPKYNCVSSLLPPASPPLLG